MAGVEVLIAMVPIVMAAAVVVGAAAVAKPPTDSTPLPETRLAFREGDGVVELVRGGVLRLGWRSIEMGRSRALIDGREVPLSGYRLSRITYGASASLYRYSLSVVRRDGTLRTLVRFTSSTHASFEGLRAAMVRQGLIRDRASQEGSSVDVPHALGALVRPE